MSNMSLIDLGWSDFFEATYNSIEEKELSPARVFRVNKTNLIVRSVTGEYIGELSGSFFDEQNTIEKPIVGDWVTITDPDSLGKVIIKHLLPRKSDISRKEAGQLTREQGIAANIDKLFIVVGLDDDYNLRRLERYLTTVYDSGAEPIVILNKADKVENPDDYVSEVENIAFGVPVHVITAVDENSLAGLKTYLDRGVTIGLVGSSGVGKSTIINGLLGENRLKTQTVSEEKSKGRHTTTHREIIEIPDGGLLMDTPGMRELQLWGEEGDVDKSFADIAELGRGCKFQDCQHDSEPGCAVQAALDSGELQADRFSSYLKQKREMKRLAHRKSQYGRHLEKKEGKRFASMIKQVYRIKNGGKKNKK